MKIPNKHLVEQYRKVSLARIVSEDSQRFTSVLIPGRKSSKDS